jgi:hypothetical protein
MNIGKFIDDKFKDCYYKDKEKAIVKYYNESGTAELGDDGEIIYQLWQNWLWFNDKDNQLKMTMDKLKKITDVFWSIVGR